MLDLFSGLGGASQAMRERGWEVITVDNDPRFNCTHTADLLTWSYSGPTPDLIWASPPCTEFSRESMPWCRTGNAPSMGLVRAALRIIEECQPNWWVLENVRGAIKYITLLCGKPKARCGPFFLWGQFPPVTVQFLGKKKESYSSTRRSERAKIPVNLSMAIALACEQNLLTHFGV